MTDENDKPLDAPLPPDDALAFLQALIAARGPSGFEAAVQRVWAGRVADAADGLHSDDYGNTWATLAPADADDATPTIVVTGHADEIGLMVGHIESSGLVRVVPIGGVDPAGLPGRRVRAEGPDGPRLGVIGAVPIHLQERRGEGKPPKFEDLFVDFGCRNEAEAQALVRIGQPLTLHDEFARLGATRAIARAFDNRIGIFAAAEAFRRVAAERGRLRVRLVALSTVQEEIGAVGAGFATRTIDPDAAIAIDVTHATDTPGISQAKHGKVTMGGGPTVTHGTSNHPVLVQRLVEVAGREGIAVQHEASSRFTGTDTDSIYKATRGVPAALVSLPNRYMHTPAELIDLVDLERLVRLLVAVVLDLEPHERFRAVDVGTPA